MKTAYVPGVDSFAIKVSAGLLRQSEDRAALDLAADDPVLGEDRTGGGAAARQRLSDRRAHRGGRRGGGALSRARMPPTAAIFGDGRAGAAAARGADAGAADHAARRSGRATPPRPRRRRASCASNSASRCAPSRSGAAVAGADVVVTTTPAPRRCCAPTGCGRASTSPRWARTSTAQERARAGLPGAGRALRPRPAEPDAAAGRACAPPSPPDWWRPMRLRRTRRRSLPARRPGGLAGDDHRRRSDRYRRAGHGHRHAGARPRAGRGRRNNIRKLRWPQGQRKPRKQ